MKKPEYAVRFTKPAPPGNAATRRGSGRAIGSYRLSPRAARLRERGDALVSAATMRVCQPGPLAFQRASVSGGSRRLMGTFASGDFGRPRGFNRRAAACLPMSLGSTSTAGRARLKSAAVSSGFSSSINSGLGLRFFMATCLPLMGSDKVRHSRESGNPFCLKSALRESASGSKLMSMDLMYMRICGKASRNPFPEVACRSGLACARRLNGCPRITGKATSNLSANENAKR